MTSPDYSHDLPLLSLAIPTYNRSSCLFQLLEMLAPQLENEPRVELIISDNASSDETPRIVRSFLAGGMKIRYRRNETNIGPDANIVHCYHEARGEYLWIFGDDDLILPGGIAEVLRHLERRQYDLVYLHAKPFRDVSQIRTGIRGYSRARTFPSALAFTRYTHVGFTFISGNITCLSKLKTFPHPRPETLIGTNLVQLSWTFPVLASNPQCLCILDSLIAGRLDNSGGHGTCQVFGKTFKVIVEQYFGANSAMARAILNRTIQSWFPWAMIESRKTRNQRYAAENAEAILGDIYKQNLRYWFFVYPVLRLPMFLADAWLTTVKIINRFDQALGYPLSR